MEMTQALFFLSCRLAPADSENVLPRLADCCKWIPGANNHRGSSTEYDSGDTTLVYHTCDDGSHRFSLQGRSIGESGSEACGAASF